MQHSLLIINICWRVVARQLSILYNSEIWPKSVGCKIVDLRSRMPSLYPGACGFGDMRSQFLYIWDMPVNAHGTINRNSSNSRNQGHVKRSEFLYRCLLHVEGFIKVMNSLEMTLKEEKGRIFKCLVAHSQLYSSKCDRWIICLILGNFSYHAVRIVYAIAWRWKRNKRIYRKIHSFDCEPAPGDIPEYNPNLCPLR